MFELVNLSWPWWWRRWWWQWFIHVTSQLSSRFSDCDELRSVGSDRSKDMHPQVKFENSSINLHCFPHSQHTIPSLRTSLGTIVRSLVALSLSIIKTLAWRKAKSKKAFVKTKTHLLRGGGGETVAALKLESVRGWSPGQGWRTSVSWST